MIEVYRIDLGDRDLMRARSWFWLRWHIEQLLNRPPTLTIAPNGARVYQPSTRLGLALTPLTVIAPTQRQTPDEED